MKKGKECLVSVMLSSWPWEMQGSPSQQALPQPCPDWVFCVPQIQLRAELLLPEA